MRLGDLPSEMRGEIAEFLAPQDFYAGLVSVVKGGSLFQDPEIIKTRFNLGEEIPVKDFIAEIRAMPAGLRSLVLTRKLDYAIAREIYFTTLPIRHGKKPAFRPFFTDEQIAQLKCTPRHGVPRDADEEDEEGCYEGVKNLIQNPVMIYLFRKGFLTFDHVYQLARTSNLRISFDGADEIEFSLAWFASKMRILWIPGRYIVELGYTYDFTVLERIINVFNCEKVSIGKIFEIVISQSRAWRETRGQAGFPRDFSPLVYYFQASLLCKAGGDFTLEQLNYLNLPRYLAILINRYPMVLNKCLDLGILSRDELFNPPWGEQGLVAFVESFEIIKKALDEGVVTLEELKDTRLEGTRNLSDNEDHPINNFSNSRLDVMKRTGLRYSDWAAHQSNFDKRRMVRLIIENIELVLQAPEQYQPNTIGDLIKLLRQESYKWDEFSIFNKSFNNFMDKFMGKRILACGLQPR